ncbi:uncharacterized protein [Typha angustifolia]|uniref:uncharacterized protein n=1 Tax=Typha angustifolia TaxID=59011 RepID=UPI003C30C99D
MVVALGPGRFYGSSLPRPRFYPDVRLSDSRVDPPVSVSDPLLSWAHEAHWSMGGLSFKRHRLQGRIEGSIKKLRAHQEQRTKNSPKSTVINKKRPQDLSSLDDASSEEDEVEVGEKEKEVTVASFRKRARKLGDEFDRIAARQGEEKRRAVVDRIGTRARSRKFVVDEATIEEEEEEKKKKKKKKQKAVVVGVPRRTSPRKKNVV